MSSRNLRCTIMVVLLSASTSAVAGEIERNFATSQNPEVHIYNKKGSVTVIGTEESTVRVTGTVGNDVTEVRIDDDADEPEIEVTSTRWTSNASEAKLTIYVPHGASLEIETVSASIDISNVSGSSLEVQTTSGSIKAECGFSEVDIEGVSGSIVLTRATGDVNVSNVSAKVSVTGDVAQLKVESVSGSIELDVTADEVDVENVSGSVILGVQSAREVNCESVSGSITFEGSLAEDGEMDLHVLSGSITAVFKEPAYGNYRLSTFSGSVRCDLEPLANLQKDRKRMEFDFGEGDCGIEMESFSGSITVR